MRAHFYAAGITWLPMLAGSVITLVAIPFYTLGYHWHQATGLAMASDFGILLQALSLGYLLHRRRMVSMASLDFREMGRCLVAGLAGGLVVWAGLWGVRLLPLFAQRHSKGFLLSVDLAELVVGSLLWAVIVKVTLEGLGSALPRVAMKRLGAA